MGSRAEADAAEGEHATPALSLRVVLRAAPPAERAFIELRIMPRGELVGIEALRSWALSDLMLYCAELGLVTASEAASNSLGFFLAPGDGERLHLGQLVEESCAGTRNSAGPLVIGVVVE